MTPTQHDIFLGTIIQECEKFIATGKKIICDAFVDHCGNRSPIAALFPDKWTTFNLAMSKAISARFNFEITPREVASFNRGMDNSKQEHWDDAECFQIGRRVRALYIY